MVAKIDNLPKISIAKLIIDNIDKKLFEKIVINNPGFLNFFLATKTKKKELLTAIKQNKFYGFYSLKKIYYNLEFVSANPTGLLHIGHARNGAYGETLTNIWKTYGINVEKEFYINDGGNQIKKLGLSVLIKYLDLFGKKFELPEDGYQGLEIIDAAKVLADNFGTAFVETKFDNNGILDKKLNKIICKFAINYFFKIIKNDLKKLKVSMEIWTPESDIYKHKLIKKTFNKLGDNLYKKDGALWLKTTKFNDDKDMVVIKSNGEFTYFAPDIAYHNLKLARGYDKIFNICGSDHKSYADRMQIALQLLGYKKNKWHVCMMQMVQLLKNDKIFKMSKKLGNSFTLQDIIKYIGVDGARWYLISQSLNTHIKINIDNATKKIKWK